MKQSIRTFSITLTGLILTPSYGPWMPLSSLFNPVWPQTCNNPSSSTFYMLRLQSCTTVSCLWIFNTGILTLYQIVEEEEARVMVTALGTCGIGKVAMPSQGSSGAKVQFFSCPLLSEISCWGSTYLSSHTSHMWCPPKLSFRLDIMPIEMHTDDNWAYWYNQARL